MLQARRKQSPRRSQKKRPLNAYFKALGAARKRNAASFTYKGSKYTRDARGLYRRPGSPKKKR
jgi:hypothetical protein